MASSHSYIRTLHALDGLQVRDRLDGKAGATLVLGRDTEVRIDQEQERQLLAQLLGRATAGSVRPVVIGGFDGAEITIPPPRPSLVPHPMSGEAVGLGSAQPERTMR